VPALPPELSARASGIYARSVYHPVARLARALRDLSRDLRGKPRGSTRLPAAAWSELFWRAPIRLVETAKASGNVNLAELAVLATAAAAIPPGSAVVEIGTFDGRTTLNLAINAPADAPVFTLDLPPDLAPRFALAGGERQFVDKPLPGARYRDAGPPWRGPAARITQLLGDSATFDWSAHLGRAGLVFVDGSHAYDYAVYDSATALRLVGKKGVVIWHDYGIWDGVTRALEDLEANRGLGLRHISGTSLVVWKAQ
jgi:hypothetical protein